MSETKTLIVSRVSDWWSWGVFLIYCWELPWRWFNKDLIRCLFWESRLKSHPSLYLSVSQNITTGNAEIPIKHRREDGDEITRDKWCGTRYFGLKLIHQRSLSPNIFPSKYIWVTWPGNSFLLPWQCDMTQARGQGAHSHDNLHHNEMFHETLLHTQNHGNSDFLLLSSDQCSILLVVIGNVTGVEMIKWYPMSLDWVWTRGWPSVSVDTTLQCPALVTIVSPLQYRGQLIQMRPINPTLKDLKNVRGSEF